MSSSPPDDEQILFVVRRGVVGRRSLHLAGGPDSARGPAPQDSPLYIRMRLTKTFRKLFAKVSEEWKDLQEVGPLRQELQIVWRVRGDVGPVGLGPDDDLHDVVLKPADTPLSLGIRRSWLLLGQLNSPI